MAGNSNSGRKQEKPFADALRMELAAAGADHKALREIAGKLIEKALAGDLAAMQEVANRTDGKPAQAVSVDAQIEAGSELSALLEALSGRTRGLPSSP